MNASEVSTQPREQNDKECEAQSLKKWSHQDLWRYRWYEVALVIWFIVSILTNFGHLTVLNPKVKVIATRTRLLDRRGHSLSQHTKFLKMRMNLFYETLIHRTNTLAFCSLRSRFALRTHENFHKKKCVSIDSKCSETHRNAKKIFFTPLTDYALRA